MPLFRAHHHKTGYTGKYDKANGEGDENATPTLDAEPGSETSIEAEQNHTVPDEPVLDEAAREEPPPDEPVP